MQLPRVHLFEPKSFLSPPPNTNSIKKYFPGNASTHWSILVHHHQIEGLVYMNAPDHSCLLVWSYHEFWQGGQSTRMHWCSHWWLQWFSIITVNINSSLPAHSTLLISIPPTPKSPYHSYWTPFFSMSPLCLTFTTSLVLMTSVLAPVFSNLI